MKRYIPLAFRLMLAFLAILVVYRLGEKILQAQVLFFLARAVFLLALAGWVGWLALADRRQEKEATPEPAGRREARALLGVMLLSGMAFVLSGAGLAMVGRQEFFPWQWTFSLAWLLQSLLAGGLYASLLWALHLFLQKNLPARDPYILPLAGLLSGMGLALLFRLGPDLAAMGRGSGLRSLFFAQLRSLTVASLLFILVIRFLNPARLEYLTRKRYIYVVFSVLLITITGLFGTEIYDRRLAINLGIMQFQTVELVKILALFFMVAYFRYEMAFIEAGKNILGLPRIRFLLPYLLMWLLILLPIFLQKDLGPTALIFSLFLVIFYLGTGSGLSVVISLLIMAIIGVVSYNTGFPSMVRTRVDMWLAPFSYSQNMAEALWALSGGGFWGAGPGLGLCASIPVVQSDFNFVALAEEWGLLGILSIVALLGLLIWRTGNLAQRALQPYVQLLLAGFAALWMLQALVIIAGNMAILPLTGITLPFISFGGSSLAMNFVMLAMVLRLSGEDFLT